MEASSSVLDSHSRLLRSVSCSTRPPTQVGGDMTFALGTQGEEEQLDSLLLHSRPRNYYSSSCEIFLVFLVIHPQICNVDANRHGCRFFALEKEGALLFPKSFFPTCLISLVQKFPRAKCSIHSYFLRKIMLLQVFFQVTAASL